MITMEDQFWNYPNTIQIVLTVFLSQFSSLLPSLLLFIIFLTFYFVLEYSCLTNNVVIVSGEQRKDSVIHIPVSILSQTPLPSRLPRNIEQSSLCYTAGPCWLPVLNIAVCTIPVCPSQTPQLSLPSPLPTPSSF